MTIVLSDHLVIGGPIGQPTRDGALPDRQVAVSRKMNGEDPEDIESLLVRVRKEEPAAQRILLERMWPQVTARIYGLCPRRESVEDLAQEVFVKVFAHLSKFRGGKFEAWVDQIARRTCYDALRKQKIRPEWCFADFPRDPEAGSTDNEHHLDHDAAEILEIVFKKLPPEMAWLLREVELKERRIGEVSEEMGWTQSAGRLRLFRARKRLKETFDKWNKANE